MANIENQPMYELENYINHNQHLTTSVEYVKVFKELKRRGFTVIYIRTVDNFATPKVVPF